MLGPAQNTSSPQVTGVNVTLKGRKVGSCICETKGECLFQLRLKELKDRYACNKAYIAVSLYYHLICNRTCRNSSEHNKNYFILQSVEYRTQKRYLCVKSTLNDIRQSGC